MRIFVRYVRSLFYAVSVVSTMYGPVAAENNNERNFTMMLMLAAGVIFAVVVGREKWPRATKIFGEFLGSVTNLVVSFGEYKTEFRQRMKRAMKFMRANNVGPHLQVIFKRKFSRKFWKFPRSVWKLDFLKYFWGENQYSYQWNQVDSINPVFWGEM